ncbi:putative xylanase/chitin deacetylase [Legionella oakridgensis ATCC 33761 = DSM 21215]|uniref:Putative xylanase/chitin deacetylase n=1 Tax=Legionella oakridgensis ATCC 33761 = DSM 21215 TaxID=1268635 RepID=W0BEY1_9GAMM|nr:putative xylanase/chitin deacetylase [Legionella oakridgensis ATCC 33761 = DSM 21215]
MLVKFYLCRLNDIPVINLTKNENCFVQIIFATCHFFPFLTNVSVAQNRQVAITIDDLPFVGESKNFHLNMIIESFKDNEVPATGFIIANNVKPENWPVLRKFRDAGLGLGNHTSSHINLKK